MYQIYTLNLCMFYVYNISVRLVKQTHTNITPNDDHQFSTCLPSAMSKSFKYSMMINKALTLVI